MDFTIKKLPLDNKRPITNEEKIVIDRALPSYDLVMGQYTKYTDEMKRKDLEKMNTASPNPFVANLGDKTYEPTEEDTREFVFSSWAEAVANVLTPFGCTAKRRKAIKKKAFNDVKKGKYLNKKVVDVIKSYLMILQ